MLNAAIQSRLPEFLSRNPPLSLSLLLSCCVHVLLFFIFVVAVGQSFKPFQVKQSVQLSFQTEQEAPPATQLVSAEHHEISLVEQVEKVKERSIKEELAAFVIAAQEVPQENQIQPQVAQPISKPKVPVEPVAALSLDNTVTVASAQTVIEPQPLTPMADIKTPVEFVVINESDYQVVRVDEHVEPVPTSVVSSPVNEELLKQQVSKWLDAEELIQNINQPMVWENDGKSYQVITESQPPKSQTGLEKVIVTISTDQNGEKLQTQLELKRMSFSNYTQFLNKSSNDRGFGDVIAFHDDVIEGRFHSNSEIIVDYGRKTKPQFLGKVTTAARRVAITKRTGMAKLSKSKRDQIFLGGIEMGVDKIKLPKNFVPFPEHFKVSEDQIHTLKQDTQLVFQKDGTVNLIGKDSTSQQLVLGDEPQYFFAEGKTALQVQGVLNGTVLVYSPYNITITGNLVYAQQPESLLAEDYLGLVSDRNVTIAEPSITGDQDIEVHAAIYAKNKFNVKRNTRRSNNTLSIYGSITSGLASATEPRFSTHLTFDRRFEKFRPPAFPMTDRFELDSWDETWRVDEGG